MLGFHEKRRMARFFFSKGTMLLLLVLVALMGYAALNAYERRQEAHERRMAVSDQLDRLRARADVLTADIAHLEDPRGIEAELRKRYDVGKEGEEVIILIDEPELRASTSVPTSKHTSLFERLARFFRGE